MFGDHVRHGHFLDSDGLDLRMNWESVGSEAIYIKMIIIEIITVFH